MKLATPKGFRDFLPEDALKRKFVLQKITTVFEKFGFDPLETPTLEYEETLTGKYGEEEKLIYKFETAGGDKVALRYDQTVPLARVAAQYGPNGQQVLPMPFKRYQIQSAFRGENTQKGRYREFLQCDADIIGVSSTLADAEILALVYEIYQALGLKVIIKINDRAILTGIKPTYLAAIDKLSKIGEGNVLMELEQKGLSKQDAIETLGKVQTSQLTPNLKEIMRLFEQMGYPKEALAFDPILIRGLDYYDGIIIEVVLQSNPTGSSLGGGGRYDGLIGRISEKDLPAVGFSVGLDRTIEAMEEVGSLAAPKTSAQVLVTVFSTDLEEKSLEVSSRLRSNNIPVELYLEPETKLDKQLKYADQKGIPYVLIIGPDEASKDKVVLKNLQERTQETLSLDEVVAKLRQ
jgi:histidyl-tRNA synthetase